ncbi:tRNA (guanine-N(1)-)-methyltransferase [Thermodesulfomicrobium sp. WS]|uniref:tRNA (guanosine(37)-N1)-methyltransferase TrmD n=1 Tax=Thermodesulfomicrobium sp. WS TaxID=3004129 RepID=UPI00248F496A|nr:tRNA (guanosine(37)-N1)-methyltransferase TrmD [Thermodesulfomicrobium sp. WS]BDV00035.1 tRNA (guanine-N(1)-)-methyltransferase [Thermodesulfomicrobium sp. WS]
MRFTLVTLFPEFFASPLSCGLLGRAVERGLVQVEFRNPRDYSQDKHRHVDDRPYGGGAGMVMTVDPVARALKDAPNARRILLAPKGRPLTQALARELAQEEELVVICGRYEGIDARLEALFPMEAVSVGDVVLNGGESAALCLLEAVSRLVPDFLGKEESAEEESFSAGLLEYPHYTRPEVYAGLQVPEILLSGDHARIRAWRREQSLRQTLALRPDLLDTAELDPADQRLLQGMSRPRLGRNLFVALVHYPVLDKTGRTIATSLTNLDLHDIARLSRTYGLGGYWVCTPVEDQQALARELLAHWRDGAGAAANPCRREALRLVDVVSSLEEAEAAVRVRTGQPPRIVVTSAREGTTTASVVRQWLSSMPVLLVLGTGHGLAPEVLQQAHACLRPVRFLETYNHLSVRSAAAIMVDRLVGDLG